MEPAAILAAPSLREVGGGPGRNGALVSPTETAPPTASAPRSRDGVSAVVRTPSPSSEDKENPPVLLRTRGPLRRALREAQLALASGGRQSPQGWKPAAAASRSSRNRTWFDRISVEIPPQVG